MPASPQKLRETLQRILPTDSELVAFCIDYFPVVASRFAPAMDRLAKENLLLQSVDAAQLAAGLRDHNRELYDQLIPAAPLPPAPALPPALGPGGTRRWIGWAVGLCSSAMIALCIYARQPSPADTPTHQSPIADLPIADLTIERILRTQLAGASVYLEDGTYLGMTPLRINPSWTGVLCLEKDGYLSIPIDMEKDRLSDIHLLRPSRKITPEKLQREGAMYRLGLWTKVQLQLLCPVLLLLMTAAKPAHAIAPECHNYSLCRDFEAKAQDALDRGDLKQALVAYHRAYSVVQDLAGAAGVQALD